MDELDHVEPALTALVLGNERLRPTEPLGDLNLGQPGLLSGRNEQLAQLEMFGRVDRLAHAGRWKGR